MKNVYLVLLVFLSVSCSTSVDCDSNFLSKVSLNCSFCESLTKSSDLPVSTLEYIFINSKNVIQKRVVQKNTDSSFGHLVDTLQCGTYECIIIGHSSDQIDVKGNVVSFPKAVDTFYGKKVLSLTQKENSYFAIELNRIISRVEVLATDSMPTEASFVNMAISNCSDAFDLRTGLAADVGTVSRLFQLKPLDVGRVNIKFGANVFTDNKSMSVFSFSVLNQFKNEINAFSTKPFILAPNTIFRFSGHAFSADKVTSGNIIINDEWDDVIENELP